ncbi:hypothetical protein EAX62_01850 [Tessaracoccus antarcticus]|uniref:Type II secretion system protein GspF domain-containing protein n=2 Tax=Tessaracoccus antarcticus TaxID=2479848 RepID=A0A3M0G8W7_9ACTN|nr:hypothetical protein EAX62_01850 [Tessaracoccus antarcticus]
MVLCGTAVGLGLFGIVVGATRRTVRLVDALALLDGHPALVAPVATSGGTGLEGAGGWLQRRLRLPVTARQQQLLLLQDRTVADFFAEKLVLALAGLLLPVLWMVLQVAVGTPPDMLPLLFSAAGGVLGYFLADWRLARSSHQLRRTTTESIHTFFDLVALERMANASATQSVAAAASISDAPLFRRITSGLERARLEQTAPWPELRRVATEWNVPELDDFADVMQLEEQGAALAEVLQARVRELRDAHLAEQRTAAHSDTESLTLWMTLPALLLGLAFIIPPLLRLTTP